MDSEGEPEGRSSDIGFCVDFVQLPPNISLIYQQDEYITDNSSDISEAEYRCACKDLVLKKDHRGGILIEIKVPTGGDEYETLICKGNVEKPDCKNRSLADRPGRIAEVLCRGQSGGGSMRRVCKESRGPLGGPLEAEYGEVDELLRRLKLSSEQTSIQLLDEGLIASVVEGYIEDIQDVTLGRYS